MLFLISCANWHSLQKTQFSILYSGTAIMQTKAVKQVAQCTRLIESVHPHKGEETRLQLDFLVTAKVFSMLSQFTFKMIFSSLQHLHHVILKSHKKENKQNTNDDNAFVTHARAQL